MAMKFNGIFKVVTFSPVKRLMVILFSLALIVSASGCASVIKGSDILVMVEGEPITVDALNSALEVEHRREDLSGAEGIDITDYLERLIGDKLIVQEGFRMEMEKYPEAAKKIDAYLLRESVVLLHADEILAKAVVSEDDVREFHKKNYERFTVEMIEVDSEELALQLMDELKSGEDFTELAAEHSIYENKDDDELIFSFGSFSQAFKDAVAELTSGEMSEIIEQDDSFFIIKLLKRDEAADEEFASYRARIHDLLMKKAEEERSTEYLEELRKKAEFNINEEVLLSLDIEVGSHPDEKWADDTRTLLTMEGETLAVKDFASKLPHTIDLSGEEMLINWANRVLVDRDALARRYDLAPRLSEKHARYKERVVNDVFTKQVILPSIEVSEELIRAYYDEHNEKYMAAAKYRLQVITLESEEDALSVHESLQKGADFTWLAKLKSTDEGTAGKGGDTGFIPIGQLPEPFQAIVPKLAPGDITPVVDLNGQYGVLRLTEKKEEALLDFDLVKPDVFKAYMAEQYLMTYKDYVERLKVSSDIIIYDDKIDSFGKIFK
jgi:parvulin-like peptidyl-prolyl isomerase